MGKISTYSIDALPTASDKVIGTDAENSQITKNYLLGDILNLVPLQDLESVLTKGNTAKNNIVLDGEVDTKTLSVSTTSVFGGLTTVNGNAEFMADVLFDVGNVEFQGGVKDDQGNLGVSGQFLSSTGNTSRWATPPASPGNLQNVLDVGNTAVSNMGLTGNLNIVGDSTVSGKTITGLLNVSTDAGFDGTALFKGETTFDDVVKDGGGSSGTSGQVLSSTATGVKWISPALVTQPNYTVVLDAKSYDNQLPIGLNAPLQVEFGAAQQNTDIELAADGAITVLTDGTYFLSGFGNVERNGNSGGIAMFMYRVLINGTQSGQTYGVDLNSVGIMIPLTISHPLIASAGDIITFEVMRDANGVNQAGLYPHQVSGGIWSTVPSASILLWKLT